MACGLAPVLFDNANKVHSCAYIIMVFSAASDAFHTIFVLFIHWNQASLESDKATLCLFPNLNKRIPQFTFFHNKSTIFAVACPCCRGHTHVGTYNNTMLYLELPRPTSPINNFSKICYNIQKYTTVIIYLQLVIIFEYVTYLTCPVTKPFKTKPIMLSWFHLFYIYLFI